MGLGGGIFWVGGGEWSWVKVYFGWVGVGRGIFCVLVGGWETVGAVTCFSITRLLLI